MPEPRADAPTPHPEAHPPGRFARLWHQRLRPHRWWLARPWLRRRAARDFGSVRSVCLFLGYPRSGHTLVGSLIDAHPDAIIAKEMDLLHYLGCGYRLRETLPLIERAANPRQWARGPAADGSVARYDYAVPGLWQGRVRRRLVVGDKQAESTTAELCKRPGLLARLRDPGGPPVKVLHVVRHPLDNIATIARRIDTIHGGVIARTADPLADAEAYYFRLAETVARVIDRLDVLTVHHEGLVADPVATLREICEFLGLDPAPGPAPGYLGAATAIVAGRPHQSRALVDWPAGARERIAGRARAIPSLAAYFADGPAHLPSSRSQGTQTA